MKATYNIEGTLKKDGFCIVEDVFTDKELTQLLSLIFCTDGSKPTFRKTNDLFAIRQFLKEVPAAADIIFNKKLNEIILKLFDETYFVVKSIYFNKPAQSNWFVAYHQDLTISVNKKIDLEGFGPRTVKQNQFAVQPPLCILEQNFTIRIHLDDTDEKNGALKVIPQSHRKGIYRPETIDLAVETESICNVKKGGIMIMKPLLLHASNRTTNNKQRRVLHVEFSNQSLPAPLEWSERLDMKNCKQQLQ